MTNQNPQKTASNIPENPIIPQRPKVEIEKPIIFNLYLQKEEIRTLYENKSLLFKTKIKEMTKDPFLKPDTNKTIENELKKRVVGQDHAIDQVKKVIYKAFTGLSGVQYNAKRTKPKGTLFFVGPTGVGKTELAKALAKFLFGDEKNCINRKSVV
mgnify:CR=1 FL=1